MYCKVNIFHRKMSRVKHSFIISHLSTVIVNLSIHKYLSICPCLTFGDKLRGKSIILSSLRLLEC